LNEECGKYSNPHSHGDDYKRRPRSSNSKGKFETGKDDLGKSNNSTSHKMDGEDDDWVPERDEMKRVRRDATDHNGKYCDRSPDNDRNHDRKYDRGIPSLKSMSGVRGLRSISGRKVTGMCFIMRGIPRSI